MGRLGGLAPEPRFFLIARKGGKPPQRVPGSLRRRANVFPVLTPRIIRGIGPEPPARISSDGTGFGRHREPRLLWQVRRQNPNGADMGGRCATMRSLRSYGRHYISEIFATAATAAAAGRMLILVASSGAVCAALTKGASNPSVALSPLYTLWSKGAKRNAFAWVGRAFRAAKPAGNFNCVHMRL